MEQWKEDLLKLPGRPEETEWLRERLEVLSVKENTVLSAANLRLHPENAADVIGMLLSLPYYEVCVGANSYEALGEFFMNNNPSFPKDVLPYVDLHALGGKYEDAHPGLFIGGNYIEYPASDANIPPYDGIHLPAEDYSWSLRLKLASPDMPEGVWVRLPDYEDIDGGRPDEIEMAFRELGVEFNSQCTLLDARCSLPGITGLVDYEDLTELIYDGQNLGIILDEQEQGQPYFIERYLAALELEGAADLKSALEIGQNLRQYNLFMASDLAAYGKEVLQSKTPEAELLDHCIDYEGYAKQVLEREGYRSVLGGQVYAARDSQAFANEQIQASPVMTM